MAGFIRLFKNIIASTLIVLALVGIIGILLFIYYLFAQGHVFYGSLVTGIVLGVFASID